jgi:hypothetical protein
MSDETSPAGWVVQVTVAAPPRRADAKWSAIPVVGAPSFHYFNVAIAARNKAVEATAKHLGEGEVKDGEMSIVRGLSSKEIAALSLTAGEVKPA